MAKMRKRTKFSLIALIIAGLAVAGAAVAIGVGAVALLPQMIAFDIAILSAGVAIGAGIAASSFSISGLISRKSAQAKSADSVATMAKAGFEKSDDKQKGKAKLKNNNLKAAKIFAKASYKLSKFGITPVTYERQRVGITNKQAKYESKRYVYGLMNEMYNQSGNIHKAKKFDNMKQKLDKKSTNDFFDVSGFAPKYHYAAEFYNPVSAKWENDERSSVNFNNYEMVEKAKDEFEKTVETRYNEENKRRGPTVVTVKSSNNDSVKEVSASSNASQLIDKMELYALQDYRLTAEKTGVDGFPILVETQDYKLDGTKKGKQEVLIIKNTEQLIDRINKLEGLTQDSANSSDEYLNLPAERTK